VQKAEHESKQ